jgi:hypothetical protein
LAKKFMGFKDARPETIYGALLVRAIAEFERYLRQIVEHAINERAAAAACFDDVTPTLARRNLVLTAKLLAAIDTPRDHLSINSETLIENLASCKSGNTVFKLNPEAFYAGLAGVSPNNVERALDYIEVSGLWDGIGADQPLASVLTTRGTRPTGDRAREYLADLCRWRNQLAHGGDAQPTISEALLSDAVEFLKSFSKALDKFLLTRLKKA